MDEKHDGSDDSSYRPGPYDSIYERPKGFKGLYQHPTTQVCMLAISPFINLIAYAQVCMLGMLPS